MLAYRFGKDSYQDQIRRKDERDLHTMTLSIGSINSIGFVVGVFIIAIGCWWLRSQIQSNPEPFWLSLTFFAFAGQFIRFAEATFRVIATQKTFPGYGRMFFLVALGIVFVLVQAVVMAGHVQMTKRHYTSLLDPHLSSDTLRSLWTEVLLRVTNVDLHPGGYQWLRKMFPANEEPKERSRKLAFAVLSREGVISDGAAGKSLEESETTLLERTRTSDKPITIEALIVPDTRGRTVYWWSYVLLCILSWVAFLVAMTISQPE